MDTKLLQRILHEHKRAGAYLLNLADSNPDAPEEGKAVLRVAGRDLMDGKAASTKPRASTRRPSTYAGGPE
jgi:hypothetical protein